MPNVTVQKESQANYHTELQKEARTEQTNQTTESEQCPAKQVRQNIYIYIIIKKKTINNKQNIYIKQILQSNTGFNDFKILKFTILTYKINKYIDIYENRYFQRTKYHKFTLQDKNRY